MGEREERGLKILTLVALKNARDLLARRGGWTKKVYARTRFNQRCSPEDPDAVKFCLVGALIRVAGEYSPAFAMATQLLEDKIGEWPGTWNDAHNRRKWEVLKVLDEVIEDLESELQENHKGEEQNEG